MPSQAEGSVGRAVFNNILQGGFTGIAYPVNLKVTSVCVKKTKTEGPLEGGEEQAFERIGFDIGTVLAEDRKTVPTTS